jgi:hypothetical protein
MRRGGFAGSAEAIDRTCAERRAASAPGPRSSSPGNGIHGEEPALFDQHARGFDAEVLDGFRRRLAGLRSKRSAELARTKSRYFGEFFRGQRAFQVLDRIVQSSLNAIRFGLEFKKGRKLRLAARAVMVDDHLARNRAGGLLAEVLLHHRQSEIDSRCNSYGRPDPAVEDEDTILLDLELRISGPEVTCPKSQGRHHASCEQVARQSNGKFYGDVGGCLLRCMRR